jgi:hypothetical protein
MSVDSDGLDGLTGTLSPGLALGSSFWVCGWFKLDVDRNDYSSFFSLDDGSVYLSLQTTNDGVTLQTSTTLGDTSTGVALSIDTWYFLAFVFNTSAGTLTPYYMESGGSSVTAGTAQTGIPGSGYTFTTFDVMNSQPAEPLNGKASNLKLGTGTLDATALLAEAQNEAPQSGSCTNHYRFGSESDVTNGTDSVGGDDLSLVGTPVYSTDEPDELTGAGPPGIASAGAGAGAGSTAGVTAALPAGIQDDDIIFILVEGEGEDGSADGLPTGYTSIGSVASGTDGAVDRTRATLGYAIYDSGSPPSTSVPDAGNHTIARTYAFRGVDPADPFDVTAASGSDGTNVTSHSAVTGQTSTVADAVAALFFTHGDGIGTNAASPANAALSGITDVGVYESDQGSDGSVGLFYGSKATAGAIGTWSWSTSTTEENAWWSIVLNPATDGSDGAGSGAITWAGSATGTTDREGATSGTVTWAGSATGAAVRTGAATGAVSWVGAATGAFTSEGAAPGTVGWAGAADGVADLQGSATGDITWAGAADGVADLQGSATGDITWAGAADGQTPVAAEGSATGAVGWAGSVAGEAVHGGTTTGSVTWAGSATGASIHQGSGAGSVTWAGGATGVSASEGNATGEVTWAGAVDGTAVHEGDASGSVTWAGAATGVFVSEGNTSGTFGWVGAAVGASNPEAVASGSVTWAGAATGVSAPESAASGSITWAGAATGEAPTGISDGTADGSITWAGAATGVSAPEGSASGSITWDGAATGEAPTDVSEGSATGEATWFGTVNGVSVTEGTGSGSLTWDGIAAGTTDPQASASGAVSWAGIAEGQAEQAANVTVLAGFPHVAGLVAVPSRSGSVEPPATLRTVGRPHI